MQQFNYHCHTSFEGIFDGRSTIDKMISGAESKGFNTIGISNHYIYHPSFAHLPAVSPMFFADNQQLISLFQECFTAIDKTAAKHKIKVLKGLEVDFFPSAGWRRQFEKAIKILKPDYLIGATHFIRNNDESFLCNIYHLENMPAKISKSEKNTLLHNYWQNVRLSIESGYFDFIAHPDYCCQFNLCTGDEWRETKLEVVDAFTGTNTACEINTGGIRRIGRPYPDWWIVKELVNRNIPLLISDDAHLAADIGSGFTEVETKLAEFGCKNRFYF